jgi:DEAD/DEAH box helicase domain-containing protein
LKVVLIARHPLWQIDHPEWQDAQAQALAQHPGYQVRATNPFRILRRPADCIANSS